MKHLKRFNEELNPSTYRSYARKLQKVVKENPRLARSINAQERSDKLRAHADTMEMKQSLEKWKAKVAQFSELGIYKFDIYSPDSEKSYTADFYLEICAEFIDLQEFWHDEPEDNRLISIPFAAGLIPTNEDDINAISEKFELDFYNGFFWGFWIYVEYSVVNGTTSFSTLKLMSYDDSMAEVQISDMRTRQQLKKLIVSIFEENSDLNKSSTDVSNLYELFDREIIQDLELYSDYGIDQDLIASDLRKIPASHLLIR